MNKAEKIGFDIGGTIFRRMEGHMFLDHGALRVMRRLIHERFDTKSYIVSKVTPEQKVCVLKAMEREGLCEITGLPSEHIYFCPERADKAPICAALGITHFIDDRPEVLAYMKGIVPHRILIRGLHEEWKQFKSKLDGVIQVNDWADIEKHLLP